MELGYVQRASITWISLNIFVQVKPSLQFSPAIITLPPTSLGDINSTSVFLENISKVPQIFEIGVPPDCPFLQVRLLIYNANTPIC